mgnify:CR=1 FL=1
MISPGRAFAISRANGVQGQENLFAGVLFKGQQDVQAERHRELREVEPALRFKAGEGLSGGLDIDNSFFDGAAKACQKVGPYRFNQARGLEPFFPQTDILDEILELFGFFKEIEAHGNDNLLYGYSLESVHSAASPLSKSFSVIILFWNRGLPRLPPDILADHSVNHVNRNSGGSNAPVVGGPPCRVTLPGP